MPTHSQHPSTRETYREQGGQERLKRFIVEGESGRGVGYGVQYIFILTSWSHVTLLSCACVVGDLMMGLLVMSGISASTALFRCRI